MVHSSPASLAPAHTTPSLECRNVSRRLRSGNEPLTVLDGVSLRILPAEAVAIVGPSGSGKSTLLGLLSGLDRPSSGQVLVAGTDLGTLDEDGLSLLRRRCLGFVFQSFQLLGNLTARENILLPLELSGVRAARARADELLAEVGLGQRGHHYPSQLSGGEQQRVALARAFAGHPQILLADEPTGNLDAESGEVVLALLLRMRERHGTTLVIVTHDEHIAARLDRRIRLHAGHVVAEPAS